MTLAEKLRPSSLDEIIGQESAKRAIKSFAEKGDWPSPMLFYGPPGCGKTTMAKIIAAMIQPEPVYVHEINASSANKVDDARALEELLYARPFNGLPRVVILNEFEQTTGPAQAALKDPFESSPAIIVLTSNDASKITEAIKSRAAAATFEFGPLNGFQIETLIKKTGILVDIPIVAKYLLDHDVTQPREILGVLEQVDSGVSLEQAIHGSEHEPLYADIAKATLSGKWTTAANLLKQVKTADSRALISVLSAKLRWAILENPVGPKADAIAACLVGIDQIGYADGTAYGAVTGLLYKTAKVLGAGK